MANYTILEKTPISMSEAKTILKKVDKDNMTYREEKSKEFLNEFCKITQKDFEKVFKKIEELDLKLESENIIKIIDILPKTGVELRNIFSNSGIVIVDGDVDLILNILKENKLI